MTSDDIEKLGQNPERKNLKSGLYLVATPIGNLGDMSMRAIDVLSAADMVYCEDTRVTRKLLNAYQIKARTRSYNDHSDTALRDEIVSMVKGGEVVALVSDAGMPLISDPGYKLVVACEQAGQYVTTIPGASAPLAALQLSGLPSDQFSFLGFLPTKSKARKDVLEKWSDVPSTLMAFESAPRLVKSLHDIAAVLGGREVAVVREITKLYEEVRKATPEQLIEYYNEVGLPKGEIVLVIAPPGEKTYSEADIENLIRIELKLNSVKAAAGIVAEKTGKKKSDLYNIAVQISKEDQ